MHGKMLPYAWKMVIFECFYSVLLMCSPVWLLVPGNTCSMYAVHAIAGLHGNLS